MIVAYVVALDRRGIIGADGGIPWRLPADMRFFKEITLGKPVIMGRKTFESIGRPLPGRHNIVITRQAGYQAEGVTVVNGVVDAVAAAGDVPEIAIIGGAEIYRLFWPLANRLYLTHVEAEVDGDTYFPDLDFDSWESEQLLHHSADEKNEYDFRIVKYEKGLV